MAFQGISTGTGPNQGDGDTLVEGAVKINANFTEVYAALVPLGGIIMWSGTVADIAGLDGWELCDGTNGTPDLQDRFIVGAGSGYGVGATGGSADAVVVSHSHGITDPGHFHSSGPFVPSGQSSVGGGGNISSGAVSINTDTKTTGISINSAGEDGTNKNLPPYYALAFIMRIA